MPPPSRAPLKPGATGGLKTRKAKEESSDPTLTVYGGPGVGKTTFAASASEVEAMSPVVILNIENGTQSIANVYPDVDVVDVFTFGDLQKTYDQLYAQTNWEERTCAGYRTVILDNLTEGQKKGMEYLFEAENRSKRGSFTDFVTGSWKDGSWNKNTEQMRLLIRAFRELPCYIIFVAWEKDMEKSNETSRVLWSPAFSNAFAAEAPGMMNDVYRLYFNRDGERALQTNRTRDVVAKDRTRLLPSTIVNPNMQDLYDYWSGTKIKPVEETTRKPGLVKKS